MFVNDMSSLTSYIFYDFMAHARKPLKVEKLKSVFGTDWTYPNSQSKAKTLWRKIFKFVWTKSKASKGPSL